ncbi:hypothetical protein I7I53_03547 [Histoplasma capsulatum var. duboisii H88]|uniref:Uncharacterized protein n=1 Tax=Ajellomyces capsulatus (strain H88) TaxID=544711 RepID=A0A8A1LQH2_AJEC8|nr:hypothetical protein I7I53_03547 [Histoplasma capsulatum var. duboisii H88]
MMSSTPHNPFPVSKFRHPTRIMPPLIHPFYQDSKLCIKVLSQRTPNLISGVPPTNHGPSRSAPFLPPSLPSPAPFLLPILTSTITPGITTHKDPVAAHLIMIDVADPAPINLSHPPLGLWACRSFATQTTWPVSQHRNR